MRFGGKKQEQPRNVVMETPTGAYVTVSRERADTFLQREPLTMPDGTTRSYRESNVDEAEAAAEAKSARKRPGTRAERTGGADTRKRVSEAELLKAKQTGGKE